MPNVARPPIEWNHTNPAEALEALCDQLGCRIIPSLGGAGLPPAGGVTVAPVGIGAQLQTTNVVDTTGTFNPPEKPQNIICYSAPMRFQVDFVLEPVGRDVGVLFQGGIAIPNETIQPIDNLSYTPSVGWDASPAGFDLTCGGVAARASNLGANYRAWARESVMRLVSRQVAGHDSDDPGTHH